MWRRIIASILVVVGAVLLLLASFGWWAHRYFLNSGRFTATADKATRPRGSQTFYESAGATDKTLKLYEGAFHDPLNDIGKESVLADIQSWIVAHLA